MSAGLSDEDLPYPRLRVLACSSAVMVVSCDGRQQVDLALSGRVRDGDHPVQLDQGRLGRLGARHGAGGLGVAGAASALAGGPVPAGGHLARA